MSEKLQLYLRELCLQGDRRVSEVEKLLRENINNISINDQDDAGRSLLYIAASIGALRLCHVLLNHSPNLLLCDGHGQSFLSFTLSQLLSDDTLLHLTHLVVDHNDYKQLVALKDIFGRTSLHWACLRNSIPLIEMLVPYSDICAQTTGGDTALHWAAMNGKEEICRVLVAHVVNINMLLEIKNNKDLTPIQCCEDQYPALKQFLSSLLLVPKGKTDNEISNDSDSCLTVRSYNTIAAAPNKLLMKYLENPTKTKKMKIILKKNS